MKFITVAALFASSSAQDYNYNDGGENWNGIEDYPDCKKPGGSPIDIKTAGITTEDTADDDLSIIY